MRLNLSFLAAVGLLSLSACGVHQDYPNDETAIESHREQRTQDGDTYMKQNEDKWMYNSCPPGAAKRGDC